MAPEGMSKPGGPPPRGGLPGRSLAYWSANGSEKYRDEEMLNKGRGGASQAKEMLSLGTTQPTVSIPAVLYPDRDHRGGADPGRRLGRGRCGRRHPSPPSPSLSPSPCQRKADQAQGEQEKTPLVKKGGNPD